MALYHSTGLTVLHFAALVIWLRIILSTGNSTKGRPDFLAGTRARDQDLTIGLTTLPPLEAQLRTTDLD